MATQTSEVRPFRPVFSADERKALSDACAAKKTYVEKHIAELAINTSPATLWALVVKYRFRPGDAGALGAEDGADLEGTTVDSYDELRLTYDGFHKVAFEFLFGESSAGTAATAVSAAEAHRRQQIYFNHPFLSPATFLAFARSDMGTVPAVALYAFAAKRLLLFRLRVQLELTASVVPRLLQSPTLSSAASPAADPPCRVSCAPCASSPLSNGLSQDDMEQFVSSMIPHLRLVRDMPPWMRPYYLCHCSRKFMFMCDTRQAGAIPIDVLMKSEVFSELLRLFESDAQDAVCTFPVGCPVDILAALVDSGAAEDDTVSAVVQTFEGDGNNLDDSYTVCVGDMDQEEGEQEGESKYGEHRAQNSSSKADGDEQPERVATSSRTLTVKRRDLFWNVFTSEYLPLDVLSMDNWFSLALMGRIYDHFTALDVDGDGVLTKEELSHYSNGSFTQLAIDRVFECHVPHTGSRHIMDYKTYLDFVIATEHAATGPALKYIWRVLDLDGTHTKIHLPVLRCFCNELAADLLAHELMSDISGQSILSEIVDMINPAWHEWITLQDMERSGQQATILPILLSYRNFYAYDCREQTAASATDEFTDAPA